MPPTPPTYKEEPVIIYEVRGTSPDQHLEMQILNDGILDFSLGTTKTNDYDHIAEVYHTFALAKIADFFNLKEKYDRGNVPSDIYDIITIHQNGRTKTVTVAEGGGAGITPPELLDIIASLRRVALEGWSRGHLNDDPFPLAKFPLSKSEPKAYTITFEGIGPTTEAILQINANGRAGFYSVYYQYSSVGSAFQLTPTLMTRLSDQLNAAHFFDLDDRYVAPDPHGVIAEIPFFTATITQGGKSKAITMRGIGGYLPALDELFGTLYDIYNSKTTSSLEDNNVLIVADVSTSTGAGWFLVIDNKGNIYIESVAAGRLSQSELQELINLFNQSRWGDLENTYNHDVPYTGQSEARIDFTWHGNSKSVEARSGPAIPPVLDNIISKMLNVYMRYRFGNGVQIGMPKTGGATPNYLVFMLLGALTTALGMILRQSVYDRI